MEQQLPMTWVKTTLEVVAEWGSGGTPSRNNPDFFKGTIPWIKTGELINKYVRDTEERISEEAIKKSSAKIFPAGSVGIAMYGATIGKLSIFAIDASTNQACAVANPRKDLLDNEFLYYFLLSEKKALIDSGKGGAQPNISQGLLKAWPIALPPFYEQKRIVAKIEELFSELDNGIAALKSAREQLKVYRQSLLKHAFEGKLTAQWREENKDKLETPEQLLARIQQEREKYLEGKITAGYSEAKRYLNKTKKVKQTYPDIDAAESSRWVSLIDICLLIVDCHNKTAPYQNDGIWLIRTPCIRNGKIHFNKEARFISEETYEHWAKRCAPEPGDLIFTREAPMGEAGVVPNGIRLCMGQRMMLLRPPQKMDVKYLLYAMMEPKFIERMNSVAVGTGVKHLRVGDVEQLCIPLFSIQEQKAIVENLEEKLSVIEEQEQEIDKALAQSETLRQSILKKAFSGKLVSQDFTSELADQIKRSEIPNNAIPFPVALPGISGTDLHAGIIAMAYRLHEQTPDKLDHFGHVKAEKISHLVESHLGLSLGRQPVKDAAGPNDYPHLKKVEHRASKANWFDVKQQTNGQYVFIPKTGFDRLLEKTHKALDNRLGDVENLLQLMLPMTMRQAEILATVYAAWNNLLLVGKEPSDEEIVTEARENWHQSKLNIARDKFFTALNWMRKKSIVPSGRGYLVKEKS